MKRKLALFVFMMLLLTVSVSAAAEAVEWTCLGCGKQNVGGKYCPECGNAYAWMSACGKECTTKYCPECGEARPVSQIAMVDDDQPTEPISSGSWPVIERELKKLKMIEPKDPPEAKSQSRYQSYGGPDGSKYIGTGAYQELKMRSVNGLFMENGYVLTEINYATVGMRFVYFPKSRFESVKKLETVELTAVPAVMVREVLPLYGPGEEYTSFKPSNTETRIPADTEIGVLFEMDGWLFMEWDSPVGLVRLWVPVDSATSI